MVSVGEVEQAKADGKKVVMRVDNITRNSRNKRNGMDRMFTKAQLADLVIYQSKFARDLLQPFLQAENHTVIMNAADADVFHDLGRNDDGHTYLYSRYNRDETKNFEVARYTFQNIQEEEMEAKLLLVGQFSPELVNNNFDFYMGEAIEFLGVITDPYRMAEIYRRTTKLIYTYWHDACSNTLIEARICGCDILIPHPFFLEGSAQEIMEKDLEYLKLPRMIKEYKEAISGISL
jgi:glycosyltransferase involved in cell wall biosynthesis